MQSGTEFNEMADALFEQIVETIDAAEAADDVELNQGVLEISCTDGSKIIVNRHAPTQEIWVAARSGGHHFRWANGVWVDTRSGETLSDAISRVVFEQSGVRITFD
jgi:CyaY protein